MQIRICSSPVNVTVKTKTNTKKQACSLRSAISYKDIKFKQKSVLIIKINKNINICYLDNAVCMN